MEIFSDSTHCPKICYTNNYCSIMKIFLHRSIFSYGYLEQEREHVVWRRAQVCSSEQLQAWRYNIYGVVKPLNALSFNKHTLCSHTCIYPKLFHNIKWKYFQMVMPARNLFHTKKLFLNEMNEKNRVITVILFTLLSWPGIKSYACNDSTYCTYICIISCVLGDLGLKAASSLGS